MFFAAKTFLLSPINMTFQTFYFLLENLEPPIWMWGCTDLYQEINASNKFYESIDQTHENYYTYVQSRCQIGASSIFEWGGMFLDPQTLCFHQVKTAQFLLLLRVSWHLCSDLRFQTTATYLTVSADEIVHFRTCCNNVEFVPENTLKTKRRVLKLPRVTTRWSTTLPSKVNLPLVINSRAICGANLVT